MAERREFEIAVIGLGGIGIGALYWASRRVGGGALGLERFELGHDRGASQDHSRIIRLSYHTPAYVRFARDAYAAWAEVEEESGQQLVIRTGGLDLYPESAHPLMSDYTRSLDDVGVPYEWMDAGEAMRRWPQWRLGDDVQVMFQEASGIATAARANAAHRRLAEARGAVMVEHARVTQIQEAGGLYELETEAGTYRAERLVIAADAWTNELLEQLWRPIDLTVTQEQVHYYASTDLEAFAPERFPIWIWMGEPSYYGFPAYGEPGAKIGWDVGGREVTGDTRTFEPDPAYGAGLDAFMREHLPGGFGPYLAQKSCLYTMTPDRDFVLDLVPGHEHVALGQGAAHAFKFASVFGRSLVELAFDAKTSSDVSAWSIRREILTSDRPLRDFLL
ncbi:MAG TPA: N-methyl-L-tryptophan oxidase [Actinomycetota bacterium]|nr:N-methyl-L-tryptophan oxidase [Actinomycetota bacterium]